MTTLTAAAATIGFDMITIGFSDFNLYDGFSGSAATNYSYHSDAGHDFELNGAGFTGGATPTGGTVTSGAIDFNNDNFGSPDVTWTGSNGSLVTMTNSGASGNIISFYDQLLNSSDDVITGSAHNDVLKGLGGADQIDGGNGADTVYGDNGDDQLYGGAGQDDLQGGSGNDVIQPGGDQDSSDGGADVDWLDLSTTGVGATINLTAGTVDFPTFYVENHLNYENVLATDGNDSILGTAGDNVIKGIGGSDLIFGQGGADTLFGLDGGDFLVGGAGADALDGGADFDVVSYQSESNFLTINMGNQALNAFAAAGDTLTNIEAVYLTNVDLAGLDDIFINDNTGRYVYGFGGQDQITGGSGSDYVDGGAGADTLGLGGGFDYVSYNSATAGVTVNLLNTALNTNDAAGDIYSGVEAFVLSEQGDSFTGGSGANFAFGYGGADNLVSGSAGGNDWFFGGSGNDFLYGGALPDLLTGEAGADLYNYLNPAEGSFAGQFDQILTFETGVDDFYMLASGFGFAPGAMLNASNFISAANPLPTTAGPTFLYYSGSGFLYFDADGTGAGAPVGIAQLLGAPVVAAGDFVFYS
jgi:Ca2+-binding RTX toxin-like protein